MYNCSKANRCIIWLCQSLLLTGACSSLPPQQSTHRKKRPLFFLLPLTHTGVVCTRSVDTAPVTSRMSGLLAGPGKLAISYVLQCELRVQQTRILSYVPIMDHLSPFQPASVCSQLFYRQRGCLIYRRALTYKLIVTRALWVFQVKPAIRSFVSSFHLGHFWGNTLKVNVKANL